MGHSDSCQLRLNSSGKNPGPQNWLFWGPQKHPSVILVQIPWFGSLLILRVVDFFFWDRALEVGKALEVGAIFEINPDFLNWFGRNWVRELKFQNSTKKLKQRPSSWIIEKQLVWVCLTILTNLVVHKDHKVIEFQTLLAKMISRLARLGFRWLIKWMLLRITNSWYQMRGISTFFIRDSGFIGVCSYVQSRLSPGVRMD